MATETNFLGIPIAGDINRGNPRVPQKPLEELSPLMQAVLNDPNVERFGWRQYTPYFNDGDPCVFSVGELWADPPAGVSTENGYDEEPDYKYDGIEYDERWGKRERHWDSAGKTYHYDPYQGPDEATYDRLISLSKALDSGEFNSVLLDAFGDHANVRITREAIKIEAYEHD